MVVHFKYEKTIEPFSMKKTQQQDKLQANTYALQQQLASQNIIISRLLIQNNALNEQINAIHASILWKATDRLRGIIHIIRSLQQSMIRKVQSGLVNQVRKLLLKIYQIDGIKKRAIAILKRFPAMQTRLIGIMHKQNRYMSNPYYTNKDIIHKAYFPPAARKIYSQLLIDIQIKK